MKRSQYLFEKTSALWHYLNKLLKQLPALMQVSSSAPLDRTGCTLPALTKSPRSELGKNS